MISFRGFISNLNYVKFIQNRLNLLFQGSLLATLILSVVMVGKSYSARKYISVFAITIGIVICTLATSTQGDSGLSMEEASKHYKEWTIGIIMLTFALLASAVLAIYQQQMYEKYGKHPDEAMFITVSNLIQIQ